MDKATGPSLLLDKTEVRHPWKWWYYSRQNLLRRLARLVTIRPHRGYARHPSFEICALEGRSTLSDTSHPGWREVYALARQEKDPARLPEICARARRLIQDRQLKLATFGRIHDDEIAELEAALRELWIMENKDGKS